MVDWSSSNGSQDLLLCETFMRTDLGAVVEKALDELPYANVKAIKAVATALDVQGRHVTLSNGTKLHFDKLSICTGASPRVGPTACFSQYMNVAYMASFHFERDVSMNSWGA